jgi:hypothetical protein
VSAVLRGGPSRQPPRVPTYECKDIIGLIGNIVLVNWRILVNKEIYAIVKNPP